MSLRSDLRYAREARTFTSKQRILVFFLDKWKSNLKEHIKLGR